MLLKKRFFTVGIAALSVLQATCLVAREQVLVPYEGPSVRGSDPTTLQGKVVTGYQGWFNCEGDGADLGWVHWIRDRSRPLGPDNITIDLWPDVSEYDEDELYPTLFTNPDGSPAKVFSSHNRKTVLRHFKWMRDYGIDSAFIQRFTSRLDNEDHRYHKDKVLSNAREGANRYGRTYVVMYDTSGMSSERSHLVFKDWRMLREKMKMGEDPAYQHHLGKPLVAIWGVGFGDEKTRPSLEAFARMIQQFKDDGCSVMLGIPTGWREQVRDSVRDRDFHKVLQMADILSPWTVGRYRKLPEIREHADEYWAKDVRWTHARGLEYMPVVYPGFSWSNLKGDQLDKIPRLGGQWLWSQVVHAKRTGANMLYIAMFDEVDEGTAIFKCTPNPPADGGVRFIDYGDVPSDHYLKLAGAAGEVFRNEREATEKLPLD